MSRSPTARGTLAGFLAIVALCRCAAGQLETRFLPDAAAKGGVAAREMRSALVKRCDTPPKIDGSLDDPAWRQARAQGGFTVLRSQAAKMLLAVIGTTELGPEVDLPAGRPVTLRVLYDDRRLYIAFDIAEPHPGKMRRKHKRHDHMLLWQDDTAEFILDPDADRKRYFHFMINADGLVTDGEFGPGIGRRERFKWTCAWKCASRLTNGRWIVEIAIPFKDLRTPPPRPGDVWLGNFLHHTYATFKRRLPNRMAVDSRGESASWSPLDTHFHEMWNLGELVFDRPPRVKIVSVNWNEPAWGANAADVVLRNQGKAPLPLEVAVVGATAEAVAATLPPGRNTNVRVPYVLRGRGKRVALTLQATSSGRRLASRQSEFDLPADVFLLRPRDEVLWTGQRRLPLDFELKVGAQELKALTIEVGCAGRKSRLRPRTRRGACVISVPGKRPVEAVARLLSAGKVVSEKRFTVARYASPLDW